MRLVIFARAQVAVPLAVALECGILIGGMDQHDIDEMVERFKADPNGVLVVTPAHQHTRITGVQGMVLPTENSFCSYAAMERFIDPPRFDAPTTDQFLSWYRDKRLSQAKAIEATPPLRLPRMLPEPDKVFNTAKECPEPRQESDEYVCGRCMLRWDVHEDKPRCPRHGE